MGAGDAGAGSISPAHIKSAKRSLAAGTLKIHGNAHSQPLKSDLSGEPIRRHVVLPNGAKIHPDELARAATDDQGKVVLGPHEGVEVRDPAGLGGGTHGSFSHALDAVAQTPGRDNDRVTLQSPHGYSVTKTRGEWREVLAKDGRPADAKKRWHVTPNAEQIRQQGFAAGKGGGIGGTAKGDGVSVWKDPQKAREFHKQVQDIENVRVSDHPIELAEKLTGEPISTTDPIAKFWERDKGTKLTPNQRAVLHAAVIISGYIPFTSFFGTGPKRDWQNLEVSIDKNLKSRNSDDHTEELYHPQDVSLARSGPGSMASWYDQHNPEPVSEAAQQATGPGATQASDKETAGFFQPQADRPPGLFDKKISAPKPEPMPAAAQRTKPDHVALANADKLDARGVGQLAKQVGIPPGTKFKNKAEALAAIHAHVAKPTRDAITSSLQQAYDDDRAGTKRMPTPADYADVKAAPKDLAAVKDSVSALATDRDATDLAAVYQHAKQAAPDLTDEQFKSIVGKLAHDKAIRLEPYTRAIATVPHPEHVLPLSGELMYYVQPEGK